MSLPANLPADVRLIWEHLESARLEKIRDNGHIEAEIPRVVKRGFDKVIARVVRSLPSDKSIDHNETGQRLFDFGRITDEVLVGRVPRNTSDLKLLRDEEKVHAVVSMSEDWELRDLGWPPGMVCNAGMTWIHLPTPVSTRTIPDNFSVRIRSTHFIG
jgi:hypothetical protein